MAAGTASAPPPPAPEDDLCVICFDGAKTRVFVPCGHLCVCAACGENVMASTKRCPICVTECTLVMPIFRS